MTRNDKIGTLWILSELALVGLLIYGLTLGKLEALLLIILMALICLCAGSLMDRE